MHGQKKHRKTSDQLMFITLVCVVGTDKETAPLARTLQTWELFVFRNLKMKYLFGCLMTFKNKRSLRHCRYKLHKYSVTFITTVGMLQQVGDTKIAA